MAFGDDRNCIKCYYINFMNVLIQIHKCDSTLLHTSTSLMDEEGKAIPFLIPKTKCHCTLHGFYDMLGYVEVILAHTEGEY